MGLRTEVATLAYHVLSAPSLTGSPLPVPFLRYCLAVSGLLISGSMGCDRSTTSADAKNSPGGGQSREEPTGGSGNNVALPKRDLIHEARRALQMSNWDRADSSLRQHLVSNPDDSRALEMLGDLELRRGNLPDSIDLYRQAIRHSTPPSPELFDKLAQQCMRAGQFYETLSLLQQSAQRHPSSPQIHFDIAGLAAMLGLPEQARPHLIWLTERNQGNIESLALLADPARAEPDVEMCHEALKRCPEDLRPVYSLARLDAAKLRWRQVLERLEPVLERHPTFAPAFSLYLRAMIELGETKSLEAWLTRTPSGVEDSPQYWHAAGVWAQQQNQPRQAARAFWEAIRRDEAQTDRIDASVAGGAAANRS